MDNLKIKIDRCFLLSFHFFEFYKYGQIGLLITTFYGYFQNYGKKCTIDEEKSSLYFYICKKKGNDFYN